MIMYMVEMAEVEQGERENTTYIVSTKFYEIGF